MTIGFVELKEQLVVEEENGEGQEGQGEGRRERSSQRERAMGMTVDDYEWTQNLSHESVHGVIIKCGTVRGYVQTQRMMCTTQSSKVNVVIGVLVVHCELLVVRVVPVVVCDDAAVRRTLVLIAFTVAFVFIVPFCIGFLLYWRYSVYTYRANNKLQFPIRSQFWCSLGSILLVVMLLRPLAECIHDKPLHEIVRILQCLSS